METPYVGHLLDPEHGGHVHSYADPEDGRIVLDVNDDAGDATTVRLTPEEAAQVAVGLLRDRSLLVTGRG